MVYNFFCISCYVYRVHREKLNSYIFKKKSDSKKVKEDKLIGIS